MFKLLSSVALVASASAYVVPRWTVPATYDQNYLEPYFNYHERYLALGCQNQHNTPFFDQCCHPMLATETLQTARGPQCVPSADALASVSSSLMATPTPAVQNAAPAPAPTPAPQQQSQDNGNNGNNDNNNGGQQDNSNNNNNNNGGNQQDNNNNGGNQQDNNNDNNNNNNGGSDTSGDFTGGVATFFFQNGVAGACGTVHSDNDFIVALDIIRFGDTGVPSPDCGRQVVITNTQNGKQVTATVADACPTCDNENCLDLSLATFDAIADESQGVVPISWHFA